MDHKELNDTLKSVSADLSRVSDELSSKAARLQPLQGTVNGCHPRTRTKSFEGRSQ